MNMIKKIIVGLGLLTAVLLGNILTVDNTVYAAEDWCSGWSKGIIKCPTEDISFTQYTGKLISLDPAGYDPAITQSKNVREFAQKIVNWALSFLGFIAVLLIIYAGFLYITAAGESEKADKSKKIITYTIIGIIIILGSYAIVNTVLTGAFSGGEDVYGEGQGYYVNGFNAPTEELINSAQDLLEGYRGLYSSAGLLQGINSDTEKIVPIKDDDFTKTLKLQYLSSVKSRLRELKYEAVNFATASGDISKSLLAIDQKIYGIQTVADQDEKNEYKKDTLRNETIKSATTITTNVTKSFVDPDNFKVTESLKDVACSSSEDRPAGVLGDHVCVLKKVYDDVFALEIFSGTDIKNTYDKLGKLVVELKNNITTIAYPDMSMSKANESLVKLIKAEDELVEALKAIKFVETKLVADVVEGSAPLIVKFNVLNSKDPSGKSIDPAQITWDLKGNDTTANGSTVAMPDDCRKRGETVLADVTTGSFNNYCIYKDPGTYRATVSIKSKESSKYATGVSAVDIKVYPPKVMVNLDAKVGGTVYNLSKFDTTGFLQSSTDVISITKDEGKSGIDFTAEGAVNAQEIVSHKWDFGDGSVKEEAAVPKNHPYDTEGTYTVIYEATAIDGNIYRKIFTIYVGSPAARIDIRPGLEAKVNDTLTFDSSRSTSDAGRIVSYLWDLKLKTTGSETGTSLLNEGVNKEKLINYTFKEPGTYTISLTIKDSIGKSSTATKDIVIESQPPVAAFTYSIPSTNQPSKVYLDASDSYDPDGKFEDLRFEWNIKGKGDADDEDNIEFLDVSAIDETSQSNIAPKILFKKIGEYDIELKVYAEGETPQKIGTQKQTIKIENVLDIEWAKDQETTEALNDAGEATVTFSFNSENGQAYEINFGDGNSETGEVKNRDTSIEHIYKVAGKYDTKVTVYDADDNSNQIKKKIFIGGNDKPIAKILAYVNGEEVEDAGDGMIISRADQVTFDASGSKNKDGTARNLKYFWDFGDKDTSSKKTVYHNYAELSPKNTGYYKVKLKVVDTNNEDLFDETDIKVRVNSLNPQFTSIQVLPRAGSKLVTPLYVNANAYGVSDKDGKVTQYRWWYYDIRKPDDVLGIQLTEIPTATLIVGTNGAEGEEKTYGFGLEITDNENNKFSSEFIEGMKMPTVTAKNGANALPAAKFTVDRTKVFAGEPINFTSNSTDPDGSIVKYIWDFEGDGFFNNDPTSLSSMQKTYTKKNLNGIKVRLKVIDDKYGESISEAVTIYIDSNALAPKAAFTAEVSGGKTVQFTNNSTADSSVGVEIASYSWDFDTSSQYNTSDTDGDGKKDNDVNSTLADPVFTYDEYGVYQVKLTVTDSHGNESFVTNSVTLSPPAETTQPAGTLTGTPGSLGTAPGQTPLKAVMVTKPLPGADGLVKMPGTSGIVAFDFSKSTGDISYYVFDKNIYFDTNGDGNPANEEDFKTYLAGEWTTNFDKSWGKTVVRLTVYDINGNKDSTVQEITFQ